MKSTLLLAGVLCFLFATMPRAQASAEDEVDQALNVSKGWVAMIDAGQYDQSYTAGCDDLHDKVPQDKWELILKSLRNPWGPVTNRTQVSHVYKPNGFEGSEGEFMVITYDSSFKALGPATEIVVLKWEGGKWRAAGYNAQAKPPASDDSTPPPTMSTTETHTDEHVKPQVQ